MIVTYTLPYPPLTGIRVHPLDDRDLIDGVIAGDTLIFHKSLLAVP